MGKTRKRKEEGRKAESWKHRRIIHKKTDTKSINPFE